MKRIFLFVILGAIFLIPTTISAQNTDTLKRDSSIVIPPLLDSSLVGHNIFDLLSTASANGATVRVFQSENIKNAFLAQIALSSSKKIPGYRIRIFFDNTQNARILSENTAVQFSRLYPVIPVYSTYVNPFFKVTVGDFRSKSEAMRLLKELEPVFKSAFLVKENINYPQL